LRTKTERAAHKVSGRVAGVRLSRLVVFASTRHRQIALNDGNREPSAGGRLSMEPCVYSTSPPTI
jgi:hypothetical protein